MKHPLKQAIDKIEFENKHKYWIEIRFLDFQSNYFYLEIRRQLVCNVTGKLTWINNNERVLRDITPDELVKIIFTKVGQFEAHEFCESFRYNGKHAYFPHDSFRDAHVPYLYGKSNRINSLILEPWRDITKNRTDWDIGMRHIRACYKRTKCYKYHNLIRTTIIQGVREVKWSIRSRWLNFKWRIKKALTAWRQNGTVS